MLRLIPILLLLVASPAWADDTPQQIPLAQKIWFPAVPVPDKVPVTPAPPADPDAVPTLAYGQVYVVQSESDFILLASPANLVAITPPSAGPITVRGLFADGPGKIETRTFKSKYVAFVDAVEKARGRVELIAIPVGVADESAVTRQLVDIGVAPQPPPPGPDDPDIPDVPPTPAPTGFRVIFAFESTAALSREQLNILHSTSITAFLNQACAKGADGRAEWRKWDKDVAISAKESATIVELWNASKLKLDTLPRMIVAVNGSATVMEFGATEAETLAKLKTAAGVK